MSYWNEYHMPTDVGEALQLLERYAGDAQIVAGGTDLILDLQFGHRDPVEALIDVTRIPNLGRISEQSGQITIGAAVTHTQIEEEDLLRRHAMALVESCSVIGGPQVRNVATLGGNVAHALPAADGTIGLLALDAEVEVCTLANQTLQRAWQPLLSIFAGPGRNTLAANQMLSAFRFRPSGAREASAFDRIMRPQGVALPILGVAARLRLDESGQRVSDAAIAIGPAGPIPFRATDAEAALKGAEKADAGAIEAAVKAAQEQARLRTSKHRASRAYRHEMIEVLLRRVLPTAIKRARNR